MDFENLLAAANVGQRHDHLTIETARTQQRRIEHIGAVGGRDDNDALVALETIHLDQQLVQGLLALVVAAAQACAAMPADGVDFIDEDDARSMLLGLLEHVAYARSADADEHLDKIRARNGEERHFGLAGYGAGQQGLAGAGRADHQHTFRYLAAKFLELAGIFQEIDDFDDFLLGLFDPRHIGKGNADLILAKEPCAALAEGHGPPAAGRALHLAHEVSPEANENQYRKGRYQQLQKYRLLLGGFTAEFNVLSRQQADQGAIVGFGIECDKLFAGALLSLNDLALEGHRFDGPAIHIGKKLRIDFWRRLARAHAELAENREQNDRQRDPQENLFRQIVQVSPATHHL